MTVLEETEGDPGFVSRGPEETERFGRWLGARLGPGDVLCLVGPMGAGKTLLTRGIAEGLGVAGGARVSSPTFTLVHEYRGRYPIYHFDLYRLQGPEELDGLGWADYLAGQGVSIVEGAERAEGRLPAERLVIRLDRIGLEARRLSIVAYGERFRRLMAALAGSSKPED
ncbi:MAG: tRNA (adenosine(37)-N6)-threonylcarbamoyltransferase complex ATPase subunit type 1 TsaE [Candidatus Methylomirabilales bacterium]